MSAASSAATPKRGGGDISLIVALEAQFDERANRVALLEKRYGRWQGHSFSDFWNGVRVVSLGLRELGLRPGASVALIGRNSMAWILVDLATQAAGGRSVGVRRALTDEQIAQALRDSDARIVFVHGQEMADVVLDLADRGAVEVDRLIYLEPKGIADYDLESLVSIDDVRESGEAIVRASPAAFARMIAERRADEACVIAFTAGTTGTSRGVVLTHAGVLTASRAAAEAFGLGPADRVVAFRRLADAVERGTTLYPALYAGAVVAVPETEATSRQAFVEIAPTFIHLHPSFVKRLFTEVRTRLQAGRGLKGLISRWWLRQADRTDAVRPNSLSRMMVGYSVRHHLGLDKAKRVVISGGPMPTAVLRFFAALGMDMRPSYALAEAGGIVLTPRTPVTQVGVVGEPLPSLEARVAADGELLVRGGAITGQYLDGPAPQDADGWLRTNDLAYVDDEHGFVVRDRLSSVVTLADGATLVPGDLENAIKGSPFVREAVVVQERGEVVALIEIDDDVFGTWARRHKLHFTTYRSLASLPEIREQVEQVVARATADVGVPVGRIELLAQPLTAEGGHLTAAGHVRRSAVSDAATERVVDATHLADPTTRPPGGEQDHLTPQGARNP